MVIQGPTVKVEQDLDPGGLTFRVRVLHLSAFPPQNYWFSESSSWPGRELLGGPHRPSSGFWCPGLRTTAFLSPRPTEAFAGGGEAYERSGGGWDDSSRTHQVTAVEF